MINRRQILIYSACTLLLPAAATAAYTRSVSILSEPFQTIGVLHRDLFPGSADIPSPAHLHALEYLGGVMNDPYIDKNDKVFIMNGAKWLNESSAETYAKPYYRLSVKQRQALLKEISRETWGDNWLWTVMSYLFESMLCDPVYGANIDQSGWRWLNYEPGFPRPKKVLI